MVNQSKSVGLVQQQIVAALVVLHTPVNTMNDPYFEVKA